MKLFLNLFLVSLFSMATITSADQYHPKFKLKDTRDSSSVVVEEDETYWRQLGMDELQSTITKLNSVNTNVAKNIIIFIGDGMSLPTVTASRIYKAQQYGNAANAEGSLLKFEQFPHVGLSKTYSIDKQTPDSASTATAMYTGVKTKYRTIGFDNSIKYNDIEAQNTSKRIDGIMKWAQEAGKDTGFVTTARVSHATPAALYAHVASRNWECDKETPKEVMEMDLGGDITKQLIRNDPGRMAKVVLGGGRNSFCPASADRKIQNCTMHNGESTEGWDCAREDKLDLIGEFLDKNTTIDEFKGLKGAYVSDRDELMNVTVEDVDYLLGLFSESHMAYDHEGRDQTGKEKQEPSLAEMTQVAISILKKNQNGFFLMVEGGRIDHSHHESKATKALDETVAFDRAIESALDLIDVQETLVIVTADHGHTMSISGYSSRGADIRGVVDDKQYGSDNKTYMIMNYANGGGFDDHLYAENNNVLRKDLENVNTTGFEFRNPSPVPLSDETHSGADVGIFSIGPYSHLFQSVHEQGHISNVMSYSACLGPYKDDTHCKSSNSGLSSSSPSKLTLSIIILAVIKSLL